MSSLKLGIYTGFLEGKISKHRRFSLLALVGRNGSKFSVSGINIDIMNST